MDPINPIAGNPESLNPNPKPPGASGSITVISMALFVLMSLAVIIFLYYQNQQLKSMLAKYQSPATSPTPAATTDPMADWSTYSDPKGAYSFKYPSGWTKPTDMGLFNDPSSKYILNVTTHNTVLTTESWIKTKECLTMITALQKTGGCTEATPGPIPDSLQYTFVAQYGGMHTFVKNGNTVYDIALDAREPNPNFPEIKDVYNQILTTFKFTSPQPTTVPSNIPVSTSSGQTITN